MKTAALSIRIDPALKAQLEKAAKQDDRSVAAFVERILRKSLKAARRELKEVA